MDVYICVYVHTVVCIYVCICVCGGICVYVHMVVCIFVCGVQVWHAYMRTYMYTSIPDESTGGFS